MTLINETIISNGRTVYENSLMGIFFFIAMLLALFGNLLVICAILTYRKLKEELSNYFIVNLAITDAGTSILVMLSSCIALVSDEWNMSSVWCTMVCSMNYCLIIVSMLTLCFISIDRYFAVCHPFHYIDKITKLRVILMIAYAWFQGIIFSAVPFIMDWVEYDYWEVVCAIQWQKHRDTALYYVIVAFVVCFLTPGIVLLVLYTKIVKIAKEKTKVQPTLRPQQNGDSKSKSKKSSYTTSYKVIFSLLIVLAAYAICMTPFSVTKLIKVAVVGRDIVPGYVNAFATMLQFLGCVTNPFIYGFLRVDFRRAFKLLVKRVWCFPSSKEYSSATFTLSGADFDSQHRESVCNPAVPV